MNDTVLILISIAIAIFLWKVMTYKTKEDIEIEKRLNESLEDEFIYDPETGTKLTLEQAESGHWIAHDNPKRIKKSEEIEEFYDGKEREIEELKNYIIQSGYSKKKLSKLQVALLEKTQTLSKYDNWTYSGSLTNNDETCFVLFPDVELKGNKHMDSYNESQMLFWIKEEQLSGHFYLREKTTFEALADKLRNDDDIKLDNYESFTIQKSNNILHVIRILNFFKEEKGLEFEIYDGNFIIKTLKLANMQDYLRIEKIIKNI